MSVANLLHQPMLLPTHQEGIIPFRNYPPKYLSVFCTDGRYTESHVHHMNMHFRDIVDAIALPGGPGNLNPSRTGTVDDVDFEDTHLAMMVKKRNSLAVGLYAHEGCLFYQLTMPGAHPEDILRAQINDLRQCACDLRSWLPSLQVKAWYGRPHQHRSGIEHVVFDPVNLTCPSSCGLCAA